MQAIGLLLLSLPTRESAEIGAHLPVAVVTHRVAGVVVGRHQLPLAVVERDGLKHRIDQPLRIAVVFGPTRGAAPLRNQSAIQADDPAVARHFLNLCLTMRHMGDRGRFLQCPGHRSAAGLETAFEKFRLNDVRQIALLENDLFRVQAGQWCVVLVHTMDGHPIHGRSRRLRQSLPPLDVSGVQQSRPIHNTDDNRFAGAQNHIAKGLQRIIDTQDRFDPTATQRMSHRRCHIESEGAKSQFARSGRGVGDKG